MKNYILFSFIFIAFSINGIARVSSKPEGADTLFFSGLLSSWGLYNQENSLPLLLGIRYIPTLNYTIKLLNDSKFDFEVAANILGSSAIHPFERTHEEGSLKPYRGWARYSTRQLEIRAGLQKINFGSAALLRPLMWFDQIDPRDPLQLTDGVWGLLGRYYFLNNANLWLWCLYGNDKSRPWDADKTNSKYPEFGGRIQTPVKKGEIGLSFHHRTTDTRGLAADVPAYPAVAENRIGLDGKWDLGIGLWFEGTYMNKSKYEGQFSNSEILNLGTDNTLGIGNGLHAVFEQLLLSYDKNAFAFSQPISFTGLSISYPVSLIDNLSLITYFDWTNKTAYNFLNLKRQFNKISFYIMAFWNPKNYQLPQQLNYGNYYAGKGIQLMLVYNH